MSERKALVALRCCVLEFLDAPELNKKNIMRWFQSSRFVGDVSRSVKYEFFDLVAHFSIADEEKETFCFNLKELKTFFSYDENFIKKLDKKLSGGKA